MSTSSLPIGPDAIRRARQALADRVAVTPLRGSPSLSARLRAPVFLKLDSHQATGSFKLRGATNALLALDEQARRRGVATASTGNHGRALAHAAKGLGLRAVVCLSGLVPANKIEAVQALGAEVRIVGSSQDDAQVEVDRLVREEGLTDIPPFDHQDVIAGQGTLGLEIVEALPEVATILVPLSGGGLAAGVAAAVKGAKPGVRILGLSMARGAAMQTSLAAGRPVVVEELETLADSLGGGIGLANRYTFAMCRALLDDVILLGEDEIAAGIRHASRADGEVVEGAGAVGIAAILAGKVAATSKVATTGPVVALVTGRNIDPARHRAIVAQGAAA